MMLRQSIAVEGGNEVSQLCNERIGELELGRRQHTVPTLGTAKSGMERRAPILGVQIYNPLFWF